MRIWIDDSRCDEFTTMHIIEKRDGRYGAYHADDTECLECEFKVEEDEQ